MQPIPPLLVSNFAAVDRAQIQAWWATLSDAHRAEMELLCDKRADSCFFGIVADESELPQVEGGYSEDDEIKPFEDWETQYFEHLLNHPELVIVWNTTVRCFHVGCTAHPDARACWRNAAVPADFRCPFQSESCLLGPIRGKKIRWLKLPTQPPGPL